MPSSQLSTSWMVFSAAKGLGKTPQSGLEIGQVHRTAPQNRFRGDVLLDQFGYRGIAQDACQMPQEEVHGIPKGLAIGVQPFSAFGGLLAQLEGKVRPSSPSHRSRAKDCRRKADALRWVGKNLRTRLPAIRSPSTTYLDVFDPGYFETLGASCFICARVRKVSRIC